MAIMTTAIHGHTVTPLCEVSQHLLALPGQRFSLSFQFGGSPC